MAHYALLNQNNIVISVIGGVDEWVTQTDTNGTLIGGTSEAWETFYAAQPWHGATSCKRTSYNNNIRFRYAGINFTYDAVRDAFITPKPYASWVLDEATCRWGAPVPYPATGQWQWNEATLSWVAL